MAFTFNTSKKELTDLLEAWILISLAFGILLSRGRLFSMQMIESFLLSALTVGLGFLLHELAHKIVAQRYGCFAEFRASIKMLVIAVAMSFFGFLIAAPGAVMIHGQVSKRQNGKISVAGPIVNLALALIFLPIYFLGDIAGIGIIAKLGSYGVWINSFLALFNMLPFFILDGKKVLAWNKKVYFFVTVPAFILTFLASQLIPLV